MVDKNKRKLTIIFIQLVIVTFFILGSNLKNPSLRIAYYSYYADVFIPFGFYFLLKLYYDKNGKVNKPIQGAIAVFLLCSTSEVLQYFGIFALARVYDPIDIIMYGLGATLALVFDKHIFSKLLKYWA